MSAQPEADQFAQAREFAGDWVVTQFRDQSTHSAAGTADAIFALAGTGGHADTVTQAVDVLADTATDYLGEPGAVTNPGGLAKVMLAVQVAGTDPDGFASYDLETELRDRIGDDGALDGVNLFAAPLAITALSRTDAGVPAATAQWLAAQQCTDPGHANLGGYGWGGDSCVTADTDTTAMALQALLVTDEDAAAARATDWLLADQSEAGGFGGNDNTNSTGLAGQALRAAGETVAADEAGAHVESLQFGPDAGDAAGGIRWLPGNASPNLMATHQAVLALGAPGFSELSVASAPAPSPTPQPSPTQHPGGGSGNGSGGGQATPASPQATAAASAGQWLASQLVDGGMPGLASTDWGLTVDALIALAATGADPAAEAAVTEALAGNVDAYAQPVPDLHIAGATAKLLYAASVAGRDPTDFGGHDLRSRTLDLVAGPDTGDRHGWLHNQQDGAATTGGNMFDQSLAVLGLARTGESPQPVVDFLVSQQCPAGGFRLFPPADGTPCTEAGGDSSVMDPDTTGMAVQALRAADAGGADGAAQAASAGIDWLASVQRASGAFHGSVVTDYPNSNSTGLAGQALADAGEQAAADRAAGWLAAQQVTEADAGAAGAHVGAVAYTPDALAAALADGLPDIQLDQWRRATAQAALGLAGIGLADIGLTEPPPVPTPTTTPPPEASQSPPPGDAAPPDGTGGGLPLTGTPAAALAGLGATALLLGVVVVVATRRRRGACPPGDHEPGVMTAGEAGSAAHDRPGGPGPRLLAAVTVTLLVGAGALSYPEPAQAAQAGYCPDADGVTVVVDFQELGGDTMIRCAPGDQGTGHAALVNAGFDIEGTARWGEAFICRIEGKPTPAEEPCIDTPPATAYWSYWHAPNGGDWTYSQQGAMNRTPPPGSFEGWSFSFNNTSGDNPPPRATPERPAPPPAAPSEPGSGQPDGDEDRGEDAAPDGDATEPGQPETGPVPGAAEPGPTAGSPTGPAGTGPATASPAPGSAAPAATATAQSDLDLAGGDRTGGGGGGPPVSALVGIGLVVAFTLAGIAVAQRRRAATAEDPWSGG